MAASLEERLLRVERIIRANGLREVCDVDGCDLAADHRDDHLAYGPPFRTWPKHAPTAALEFTMEIADPFCPAPGQCGSLEHASDPFMFRWCTLDAQHAGDHETADFCGARVTWPRDKGLTWEPGIGWTKRGPL